VAQTKDAQQREQYARGVRTEVVIARTRADVASLSGDLVAGGMAGWGGGSVSARVPGADLFLIKPPAGAYDDLAPENMILCDLDGTVVAGTPGSERMPGADAAVHAHVLRALPTVGGVVFSQSPHALATAAAGEGIACLVASMAERFGGAIPVATAPLDDPEAIGRAVVGAIEDGRSPAVVVAGGGAYVVDASPVTAVRTAALVEELARVAVLARSLGAQHPISSETIDRLHAAHRGRAETQTTDDRR
jgi:L-ribulose-5-phosphate 4-epimerase